MIENLNLEEDANIKFVKLCEIVADIEKNGQEGDQFSRQAVLSGIVASKNEILWSKLEETLFEEDKSELMRTVIVGLLMQNENINSLCQYAENTLKGVSILGAEFEDKESLLLLADSLITGTKSEDAALRDKSVKSLFDLYKASCHFESSALIADQLLQRFINILPNKNKLIDDNLLELIKDTEVEINSRVISIEILSKSQPIEFFEVAVDLVFNLSNYSRNNIEKIYMLDILTKYIYNASASGIVKKLSSVNQDLSNIDIDNILNVAKQENGNADSEHFDVICKRISRRISQLNELSNSNN